VSSSGLTSVSTGVINVTAAGASQLVLLTGPPTSFVAEDVYGNRATQFTGNVSIALANNPTGAALVGGPLRSRRPGASRISPRHWPSTQPGRATPSR
jgi:hypothetical protein